MKHTCIGFQSAYTVPSLLWREGGARSLRRGVALLAVVATLLAGCKPGADVAEHVELVTDFDDLGPAATFELRFDQPMEKPGRIGIPATNSPLVITPAVRGSFVWLSPRSGRFTPSEPMALGSSYRLSLAPDLLNAEGQPIKATLRKTLHTPPFSLAGFLPTQTNANASALPEVKLIFNADVRWSAANHFIEFRDSLGRRIAAEVRQGILDELPGRYEFGGMFSLRTWDQQFADRQPRPSRSPPGSDEGEDAATNTVPNFLVVSPRKPLPIGEGWRLVIDSGLPSATGGSRLGERRTVPLGDVTPFTLAGNTARNVINHLPSIRLEFSKPLSRSLTNGIAQWVVVDPSPTNLTVEVRGNEILLGGGFKSDTPYTFTIRAGLPAEEPFTVAETQVIRGSVPRVEPRLYFPALSGEQLANGNRTAQLLAVNVPNVRLRAKLLDPATAIHALRGYEGYVRSWRERESWEEPFRRVDYNLVPGRTVFNEEVAGSGETDVAANPSFSWDTLLKGRRTGLVFLDAERSGENADNEARLGTQTLIQLTDLGIVWKDSPARVQAFVFSHTTGKPVLGAGVRLLSDENESLGGAVTGDDGIAQIAAHTNAQWLAIELGDDFHAVHLGERTIPLYTFRLPSVEFDRASDPRRVMLFADRELYRPGETMQLKAIVRDWADEGLTIPAGLAGTLTCMDGRERKVFETNVVFSSLGSCAATVPLNSEARGWHRCVLKLGAREYDYGFQVQDYQPSAFEIDLKAKTAYGPGERIVVPLAARYYFGKPLSQAQVAWSLEAQGTEFTPAGFDAFNFGRTRFESRFDRGPSSVSLAGQERLSGATNVVIAPELPLNAVAPQPRAVSLLVEVTDINQQTLSRQAEFIQHSSEFYLGLKQTDRVQVAGKELPLEIVAVSNDAMPWPHPVSAKLKLQRIEWEAVRIQGAGRSIRFRNEAVFSNITERVVQLLSAVMPARAGEAVRGTPVIGLIPPQAGQYLLEATTTDDRGHPVVTSLDFTVSAREELAWDYRNDVQMTLKPDRDSYAPGETAQILVEAPFSGMALVTVERENVLRSFTTRLEGNAPMIRVPIEAGDVPNLFVSVTVVRGTEDCPRQVQEPEYRVGYCQVLVRDPRRELSVTVSASATNYLPGQTVTALVDIKDGLAAAVNGAEVTLYAVDEGVLSLSGTQRPDPYSFFYAACPLSVETGISLPNLVEEDPAELRFGNKGYLGGGGGAGRVRKNFLACAFWSASLLTDTNGQVQASFQAPDSVTRYRLVAVAHTRESQFGSGQSAFQVAKPLLVEPALPRFANVTDRLQARAVVLNQTAKVREVEVTLELDKHAMPTEAPAVLTRRITVPANGSAAAEFPVEFVEPGTAKWVWRGHFSDEPRDGFTDAVQSTFEVGYPTPLLREILRTKSLGAEIDLLARANPQLMAGNGTITVELANSRLIGLGEAVSSLLHYPYGCAEQTSSSLLPWIVLRNLPEWSPFLGRHTNNPAQAIRTGVSRLFSMQTQSGGLGYWPGDREPMFWASAYGGVVLAFAQRHGVQLPQEDFRKLLDYLSAQLRENDPASSPGDGLCLAVYALALTGRAEAAYHEKLFSQRQQLSLENRALLALAITESRGPREMVDELLAAAAPARAKEDLFGCSARQNAIRLLARVCARPDDAGIDEAVANLMDEQVAGQWSTTQGNAWAALALVEYGRRVEGTLEPAEGDILWGDEIIPYRLDGTNNVFSNTFKLAAGAAVQRLKLRSRKGTVFASTTLAARPPVVIQPHQDQGFNLQRRYERLNDDGKAEAITNLHVGDRVLITLRLEARQPAHFVAVDDALPSNLEAINAEFKGYQTRGATGQGTSGFDLGNDWSGDFQEIRTDRVLYFANNLAPGNYLLQYLARVRAAATVTAPAAKVEEMYHPNRYGLSATQVISSQAME